jgi:hypothetical protein
MLAFPALQAGAFLIAANCGVILYVVSLCGKATRTVTHPFTPIAGMLQDDYLPSDDGASGAEAASSAEFHEFLLFHPRPCGCCPNHPVRIGTFY